MAEPIETVDALEILDSRGNPTVSVTIVLTDGSTGNSCWRRVAGGVTHVFTHFPLELVVYRTQVPQAALAPDGMRWISARDIPGAALPSLMRKVLAHARVE